MTVWPTAAKWKTKTDGNVLCAVVSSCLPICGYLPQEILLSITIQGKKPAVDVKTIQQFSNSVQQSGDGLGELQALEWAISTCIPVHFPKSWIVTTLAWLTEAYKPPLPLYGAFVFVNDCTSAVCHFWASEHGLRPLFLTHILQDWALLSFSDILHTLICAVCAQLCPNKDGRILLLGANFFVVEVQKSELPFASTWWVPAPCFAARIFKGAPRT